MTAARSLDVAAPCAPGVWFRSQLHLRSQSQTLATCPTFDSRGPIPLHSQVTGVEVLLVVSQPLSKSRFLTVQEVADLMRVSTMTVYRIIKAGDLAAVRVGRSFRVRESDVDAYLGARYSQ